MQKQLSGREDIYRVLSDFYDALLLDDTMRHFFKKFNDPKAREHHLQDLCSFWEQSLFYNGSYDKNVMRIHQDVHAKDRIRMVHIDRWLELFRESVDSSFEGTHAERMKNKALSIATVMRLKMDLI